MPKKASGRKKGIQRGVPRHQVRSKKTSGGGHEGPINENEDGEEQGLSRSKYFLYSQKCFESTFKICRKLHLIGFKRTSSGEYVLLSTKDQIWHCTIIVIYLAVCLRNMSITIRVLLNEELGVESFMCVTLAFIYLLSFPVGLGIQMRPKETIDVLNSWSYVSLSPQDVDSRREFHPLQDKSTCCKVISALLCCYGITTGVAVMSTVVSNLPVCLFPTAERYGLIPEGILPRIAWQTLFAPLEWILYLPPVLVAHISVSTLFMGTGAVKVYMKPLRAVRVSRIQSRRRLERMYVQLELFNRIFQVWIRFFFPPWLLGYAVAVIIALFISIRYTDLPFLLYINYPNTAVTLLMLIFWQSFDMVCLSRESEDILGVLLNQHEPYLKNKTRKERVEVMKRARVMRPLTFPLADSEFSLSLPVNTWEEILNQVLFLMSL